MPNDVMSFANNHAIVTLAVTIELGWGGFHCECSRRSLSRNRQTLHAVLPASSLLAASGLRSRLARKMCCRCSCRPQKVGRRRAGHTACRLDICPVSRWQVTALFVEAVLYVVSCKAIEHKCVQGAIDWDDDRHVGSWGLPQAWEVCKQPGNFGCVHKRAQVLERRWAGQYVPQHCVEPRSEALAVAHGAIATQHSAVLGVGRLEHVLWDRG
eukprot:933613-Rhodomonas_salina.3